MRNTEFITASGASSTPSSIAGGHSCSVTGCKTPPRRGGSNRLSSPRTVLHAALPHTARTAPVAEGGVYRGAQIESRDGRQQRRPKRRAAVEPQGGEVGDAHQ